MKPILTEAQVCTYCPSLLTELSIRGRTDRHGSDGVSSVVSVCPSPKTIERLYDMIHPIDSHILSMGRTIEP